MKKIVSIIMFVVMSIQLFSCAYKPAGDKIFDKDTEQNGFFKGYGIVDDNGRTAAQYDGSDVQISRIVTNATTGKTYIEFDGEPFVYIGGSIRTDAFMNCDLYNYAEIEVLFKEAKELGVTCVQIPVEWKDIEPEKDVWDYSYLHAILSFTNKYNLKAELLWFGTNMVGDTHANTVPNYILSDGKTYTKFDALRTGEYWNYYGLMWYLDFNDADLIARETLAVKNMMQYVYDWDSTHGALKPILGVQVLNEADAFFRWRITQSSIKNPTTGELITYEEGLEKVKESLDSIGKEVKKSKYKVFTRTNLADSTGGGVYEGGQTNRENVKNIPDFAKEFLELEGIDIVGDDSYKDYISTIKGIAYMYGQKTKGNYAHFAENDGSFSRTPKLILAAFSVGAGYSIYDICTSPYYIKNRVGGTVEDIDQGIITATSDRSKYDKKNHYADTKNVINALKAVGSIAVTATLDDFAVFGVTDKNLIVDDLFSQTIKTTHTTITVSSNESVLGYAIEFSGKLYIYMLKESNIKLANATFNNLMEGNDEVNLQNDEFVVKANTLYIVDFMNGSAQSSTVWDNIG